MNILLLTSRMGIGGAETHILTLATGLVRLGHSVVCASSGGVLTDALDAAGIPHITLPLDKKDKISLIRSYIGIKRIIKKYRIDTLHSHSRIPSALAAIVKKRSENDAPVLVTTAHMPFVVNPVYRRASAWGDAAIAVSEDLREYLVREYAVSRQDIFVIENGVDTERYADISKRKNARADIRAALGIYDDEYVICCASRSSHSRADALLCLAQNAARSLCDDCRILLLISGSVGREEDLSERIKKAARDANTTLGRDAVLVVDGKSDIYPYLCASDVFVGVSRAAIEAMAIGVPVILYGNEGYASILTSSDIERLRESNLTARGSDGDASALFDDIYSLKNNKSSAEAEALLLSQYASEHFSMMKMAEATADVYKKTAKKARNRVLVIGYFGAGNLGDESMRHTLSAQLGGELCLRYLTIVPSERNDIRRTNILRVIKEIKRADAVIFGCGNLIQDETSRRSLFYYSTLLSICRIYSKRVAVFSNGIGPLKDKKSNRIASRMLECADYISVREPRSLALSQELSNRSDIKLGADTVFLCTLPDEEEQIMLCRRYGISERYILLCPRKNADRRDIAAMTEYANKMAKNGYGIVIFPMQESADMPLCKNLAGNIRGSVLISEQGIDIVLSLISRASLIIGARLHATVYSLMCNTPVVSFDRDSRIAALCEYAECGGVLVSGSFDCSDIEKEAVIQHSLCQNGQYKKAYMALFDAAKKDMGRLREYLGC